MRSMRKSRSRKRSRLIWRTIRKEQGCDADCTHTGKPESQEESAALLKKTEEIAENQKTLASLDKRVEAHKELSGIYGQWIDIVTVQQWMAFHRGITAC